MKYVTFVGRSHTGATLRAVTVRAFSPGDLRVVVDGEFGVYFPGEPFRLVHLEPGEYSASVAADGFIFDYPATFEIPDDESGETADDPIVVELTAASPSVKEGTELPFRLTGHITIPPPTASQRGSLGGFGVTYRGSQNYATTYRYEVHASRIDRVAGRPSLQSTDSVTAAADTNGRFEVLLLPNTLYSLSVPGIQGNVYIETGASGESGEMRSLVEALISTPTYELVR